MKTPPLKSPLNADVTIDSSKNDNGYLANARLTNPNARAHRDAAVVPINLAYRKSFNAIISHGEVGVICAGSGMSLTTANQLIDINNVTNIGFDKLGVSTAVVIYACHTGAGVAGATLLFEIAKQVKAPVFAPNGFIFLDDKGRFSLQQNAKWQKATQDSGPPQALGEALPPTGLLSLPSGGIKSWSRHPWDRLTQSRYDHKRRLTVPSAQPASEESMSSVLFGGEAQLVIKALGLSGPYRIKGAPGAVVTGDLEFEFENSANTYRFRVFNDRLIEEVETGLFYFTKEAVSSILQGSRPPSTNSSQ